MRWRSVSLPKNIMTMTTSATAAVIKMRAGCLSEVNRPAPIDINRGEATHPVWVSATASNTVAINAHEICFSPLLGVCRSASANTQTPSRKRSAVFR